MPSQVLKPPVFPSQRGSRTNSTCPCNTSESSRRDSPETHGSRGTSNTGSERSWSTTWRPMAAASSSSAMRCAPLAWRSKRSSHSSRTASSPDSAQNFRERGLTLHSLASWADVLDVAKDRSDVDAVTLAELERFLDDPIRWSRTHGVVGEERAIAQPYSGDPRP